jgi:hypothetical protein
VNAPGLGGRIHDPDTLRRIGSRTLAALWTSRVPEPAPLRMRSRRGLRVRLGPSPPSPCSRDAEIVRAPYSPALLASASSSASDSFALGRACPWLRNLRPRASRPKMRPIDFCTLKPFPLEHPYFVASQRSGHSRATPFGAARGSLSSQNLSAPCSTTRTSVSRAALARPKTGRSRRLRARGRPTQTRLGGTTLHGALPTSAPGRSAVRALSSLVVDRCRTPLTPVSPPPSLSVETHATARRPPRSVPREPRERRAHSRSRVPSVVSRHAHPFAPRRE